MYRKNLLKLCRFASVALGFIILCLGYSSHHKSASVQRYLKGEYFQNHSVELHELCQVKYFYGTCPGIIVDQYYVGVISINFIFSIMALITYYLWYKNFTTIHPLKWVDFAYHGISALVLASAATVYLMSAVENNHFSVQGEKPSHHGHRIIGKFLAGVLTVAQALLHIAIAVLVARCTTTLPSKLKDDISIKMETFTDICTNDCEHNRISNV